VGSWPKHHSLAALALPSLEHLQVPNDPALLMPLVSGSHLCTDCILQRTSLGLRAHNMATGASSERGHHTFALLTESAIRRVGKILQHSAVLATEVRAGAGS